MTGFTIGMLAAGIWVAVAVGLWFLLKRSPGHPFRSIREFRRVGRKLAEPIAAEPDPSIRILEATETGIEVARDQLELFRPAQHAELQDEFVREEAPAVDQELEEINVVITAVTSEKAPRPKRPSGASARRRTAAVNKPVRKIGKFTYVVVDDDGKPEADLG